MDKTYVLIALFFFSWLVADGQERTISLEQCLASAALNNPVFQKYEVIEGLGKARVEKTAQNWWPNLKINGQLTWQNEVTQLNIDAPIPGFEVPEIPKTQYRIAGELTQTLYDGGMTGMQKAIVSGQSAASLLQSEVQQQDLSLQIQELYFNALLLEANLQSIGLVLEDLTKQLESVKALKSNGMVTGAAVERLKAEMLRLELQQESSRRGKSSVLQNLSLMTGLDLAENVRLEMPAGDPSAAARKEYALFDKQKEVLGQQLALLNASGIPRLQAFALGGYGQPGFNFLDESPAFLFQAGLRLRWDISSFYTNGKDREILSLNQLQVQKEKEAFDLVQNSKSIQLQKALDDFEASLQADQEIISLRSKIKDRAAVQLENGTITTAEYIQDVNEWSRALIERDLHQIQLLQTIYSLRFYP